MPFRDARGGGLHFRTNPVVLPLFSVRPRTVSPMHTRGGDNGGGLTPFYRFFALKSFFSRGIMRIFVIVEDKPHPAMAK